MSIKDILIWWTFFLLGIILKYYNLPITIIDLIVTPLFLFFTILIIENSFQERNNSLSKKQIISLILFILIITPLSLFGITSGWQNPLALFSGVKGAAHWYSLLLIGIGLVLLWILAIFRIIRSLSQKTN